MAERGAVVITGASTGIGEATAARLAAGGFQVFAGVRTDADADRLRSSSLPNLLPLKIDVADSETIHRAYEVVREAVGDAGLAGLINNAGVSMGGPLEFEDIREIRQIFNVNVLGLIETTQAFMPLIRRARGRVICTGSISARTSPPFVAAYGASKAAVQSLCHSLRVELRPWGIKVICIEPGSIATPIWDKGLEAFDRQLDAMPREAREHYGDMVGPLRDMTVREAERGIPAARVAEVMEEALTAARPHPRYLVGADARAMSVVARLPDRTRDALISRYVGVKKG
jgi:NAD(P)-dependent dehydrogenase (short-subunit alcohol dehydrogenase family)